MTELDFAIKVNLSAQQLLLSLIMEAIEESEFCFSQLNNSCRKMMSFLTEAKLIYCLLCFITVLTVILNLLVIISISHFRQRYYFSTKCLCFSSCNATSCNPWINDENISDFQVTDGLVNFYKNIIATIMLWCFYVYFWSIDHV